MQDTKTGFQKYVFKGNAVALSGSIRKPYFQDLGTHAAISALAGSAGYIAASSRDFALQKDVTYDHAESEIRAERRDPICQMVMRTTITNLRVGPRIAVEGVVAQLRARYDIGSFPDRKMARLSPAGSTIRNLSIDGEVREVELPPAFRMDPKEEEEFLNGGRDDDERCYPGNIPTPFYIEGLGTIFNDRMGTAFAIWSCFVRGRPCCFAAGPDPYQGERRAARRAGGDDRRNRVAERGAGERGAGEPRADGPRDEL